MLFLVENLVVRQRLANLQELRRMRPEPCVPASAQSLFVHRALSVRCMSVGLLSL